MKYDSRNLDGNSNLLMISLQLVSSGQLQSRDLNDSSAIFSGKAALPTAGLNVSEM
jgi:PDZ domain-containing secreted protein